VVSKKLKLIFKKAARIIFALRSFGHMALAEIKSNGVFFMAKFTNPLDNIKIASPCSQDWDAMIGNERQRHCGDCRLNVYNLSGMTRREAESFLINVEGRVCVRYFKRTDGTVLSKDCPVGWRAIKRHVSKMATAFASLIFAVLSGIGLTNYFAKSSEPQIMGMMLPKIENTTMGEVAIGETNSNVAVQDEPIATMGNILLEEKGEVVGMRVESISRQKKLNRR